MKKWMTCICILMLLTGCSRNDLEVESDTDNVEETVRIQSDATSDTETEVKEETITTEGETEEKSSEQMTTNQKLLGGMEPNVALEYMKSTPDLVIVEVNAPEWKLSTGFTGAMWIPYTEMEQRYNEIPEGVPVMLHCGGGIVSVDAYEILIEKRPDIPELSYIAGAPPVRDYNEWLAEREMNKE